MRTFGYILVGIGVLSALIGVLFDTTVSSEVPGRIHNIGLLNFQLVFVIIGGTLFVSGVVCLVGAEVVEALVRLRPSVPAATVDPAVPAGSAPAPVTARSLASADRPPVSMPESRLSDPRPGQKVRHAFYGEGEIVALVEDGKSAEVRFERGVTRRFALAFLEPV